MRLQETVGFRLLVLAVLLTMPGSAAVSLEVRAEDLLRRMTLEEKVGQMTQLTLGALMSDKTLPDGSRALDPVKVQEALTRRGVGSVLNVGHDRAYTAQRWRAIILALQSAARRTRLKIPVLYGIDAIHGAGYTTGATLFPQPVAQAAAFDPELVRRIGEATAAEVRASGIPWNFYPVMDLGRQPRWPRFYETFGEDSWLAGRLGAAYVSGLQSRGAAACLKHFVGYSIPFSGMDRTPALLDERTLREWFLPPFEAGVRAGAMTVMVNSGEISGVPGHANRRLLTEVLKGELGFSGLVVSDWEDVKRLHTRDRVAETPKEAVRLAVMAGVDMSMVPDDFSFPEHLAELVREGKVPESRVDDAAQRILAVKLRLGLFAAPVPSDPSGIGSAQARALNRRAAAAAMTLLRNEGGTLPLRKDMNVLVTGPAADSRSTLNGGWTISHRGDREELYPRSTPTILGAIRAKLGASQVVFVPGSGFDRPLDIPAAVSAAKSADAVVVALGERPYCETPGHMDLLDMTLDAAQLDLASALIATGKPVAVVLVSGRPRVVRRIADTAPAILMAYLPGAEGGRAVAEVLFGDAEPSGRLPFSYPRGPNAMMAYDHKPLEADSWGRSDYDPEWPFGWGLSYTTFTYAGLALSAQELAVGADLRAWVTVANAGRRRGTEVAQLYVTDLYGSVSRPVRQLRGVQRLDLAPGEARRVAFTLRPDDLSFIGADNRRVVEAGRFRVTIGDLQAEFSLLGPPSEAPARAAR